MIEDNQKRTGSASGRLRDGPLRVLVAFDKFKYAMGAGEICTIAATTVREKISPVEVAIAPLTDGGEGFVSILVAAAGGVIEEMVVTGPRGQRISAKVGRVDADKIPLAARRIARLPNEGRIGVIEMAQAAGIELLTEAARDPFQTTTAGVGEMISTLADRGVEALFIGIGGSATNDLGTGCIGRLGGSFRDKDGVCLDPVYPGQFGQIATIATKGLRNLPPIRVACDVENPLLGPGGATAVFGPQKGLRAGDFETMETGCERISRLLLESFGKPLSLRDFPGAGAAGGLGFGLMAAFGAKLVPGFEVVEAWMDLERRIEGADLVLTGEGKFDLGSLGGKGPGAIARRAWEAGKQVRVFAGAVDPAAAAALEERSGGKAKVIAISPQGISIETAIARTGRYLAASMRRHWPEL